MTSNETITISKADYEALLQRNEDLEDLLAAVDANRTSGRVPHKVAVAIANGHSPITASELIRAYHCVSLPTEPALVRATCLRLRGVARLDRCQHWPGLRMDLRLLSIH